VQRLRTELEEDEHEVQRQHQRRHDGARHLGDLESVDAAFAFSD
jgi:hypothetical protein